MADVKKEGPKVDPLIEDPIAAFFILLILGAIAERINWLFRSGRVSESFFGDMWRVILHYVSPVWAVVATILTVGSVIGIVYSHRKLSKLNEELNEFYRVPTFDRLPQAPSMEKNRKWERVLAHMASPNESEWKLAIIEADIMLGELLEAAQYRGETIADKLKSVERSDFDTIEAAWEAHKARNQIAHEGSDFILTRSEAERIIALFRMVFEEFHFI